MDKNKIARINELAKKSKESGLTDAEKAEQKKPKRASQYSGGYFDWVEQIESGESSVTSLKELAGRLRKARESMQEPPPSPRKKQPEFNEQDLQLAVKDGNYEQAIVILKQLNLNNQNYA